MRMSRTLALTLAQSGIEACGLCTTECCTRHLMPLILARLRRA